MKTISGYKVLSNNEYVALAYNEKAVQPWVTWQHNGDLNCYWGHYFDTEDEAYQDYLERIRRGK